MALIQCPECGQSISDKAAKCPKCGYPIQEHLNGKTEKLQDEYLSAGPVSSASEEHPVDSQQTPAKKGNRKKTVVAVAACAMVVVVIGIILCSNLFLNKITVENINISKWRLTDSSDYFEYYEGAVTSEQKKPFVAVIGRYDSNTDTPQFVYLEDGVGVIQTTEFSNGDPSVKYKAIGYLSGTSVELSDINVKYTDSDYDDWEYLEETSCNVLIDIDMGNTQTGILVFDVVNETSNEIRKNEVAVVVDGKAEYSCYFSELPYKARGVDVSIIPKLFCKSTAIKQEDYVIEQAYTAKKNTSKYYTSYSGEEILSFANHADGFVLYTEELTEGGNKKDRNVVRNSSAYLHDGECKLSTYDSSDGDKTMLAPNYNFNIVGYITWTSLEKEKI